MASRKSRDIPGKHSVQLYTASHAADAGTEKRVIWVADCDCKITDVDFCPFAAVTGQNTDTTDLNILDGGAAGAGTTEIGNLDLTLNNDLSANTPNAIINSGTSTLDEGDSLILQLEQVGNGLAVGAGLVVVTFEPI